MSLRSAGWEAPASYDLVAMAGSVDQLGAGRQWVGVDDHVALRVNSIRLVGSRCERVALDDSAVSISGIATAGNDGFTVTERAAAEIRVDRAFVVTWHAGTVFTAASVADIGLRCRAGRAGSRGSLRCSVGHISRCGRINRLLWDHRWCRYGWAAIEQSTGSRVATASVWCGRWSKRVDGATDRAGSIAKTTVCTAAEEEVSHS